MNSVPTSLTISDESVLPDAAELVEQAADGAEDAFAELVRRHQRSVRMYLSQLVNSAEDADDLAQEVFITAYRNLATFERRASFGAWLMGIARHRAMHHLRTELRRRKREGDPVRIAFAASRYEQANNIEADSAQHQSLALRRCLDMLPRKSHQLIDAYYFKKRSTDEIARDRKVKPGAIRMTLFRIRRVLADCIKRRIALEEIAK